MFLLPPQNKENEPDQTNHKDNDPHAYQNLFSHIQVVLRAVHVHTDIETVHIGTIISQILIQKYVDLLIERASGVVFDLAEIVDENASSINRV